MGQGFDVANSSFLAMSGIVTANNTGFMVHTPVPPKIEGILVNATLSAIGLGFANQSVTVVSHDWGTFYSYTSHRQLLLSYGTVAILTVVSVVVGLASLTRN